MGVLTQLKIVKAIHICTAFVLCLRFVSAYAEEKPLALYEQKIKAGLVYNLLKYTTWPKASTSQEAGKLHICLFGNDAFDGYLSPLEGRTAQQVPIFITQVTKVQDTADCSVIVIHRSEEQHLNELLQFLKNKNILTISDIEQFAQRGGMVEMTREEEKISIYINTDAVNLAQLDIQERMLKLAKIVSSKIASEKPRA